MFNFETISEHDILSRTINEVHKCVLPKTDKFESFNSPEKIAENSTRLGSEADTEVTDPRIHYSRFFKRSYFLINDYGYASELNNPEQKAIFDSLSLKITHNPTMIMKKGKTAKWTTKAVQFTPELVEKREKEIAQFQKCAEIYFYRHNNGRNSLIDDNTKSFLVNRWKTLESIDGESRFQVITMLLRDQDYEGEVEAEFLSSDDGNFIREAYLISENNFPSLDRLSTDDLIFYLSLKNSQNHIKATSDLQHDITISVDMISTLLVDSDEFSVHFQNHSGKRSKFHDPLPLSPVTIANALDAITKLYLYMSLDLDCMNRLPVEFTSDVSHRHAEPIDEFMRRRFMRFVAASGSNGIQRICKIKTESQSFTVLVSHSNTYTVSINGRLVSANLSIKMEYQTKFGVEQMTRGELIKEWCALKFNEQSITLRFRIDAGTLKILSITLVTIEDIELTLNEAHNTSTKKMMGNLVNVFCCLHRIPQGDYMMQTKLEDKCKKLFIYKIGDSGKELDNGEREIEATFTRKWLAIDANVPNFLHVKNFLAPCCFPNIRNKQLMSYLPKVYENKKIKPKLPQTVAQAQAAVHKRKNLQRKLKRKKRK